MKTIVLNDGIEYFIVKEEKINNTIYTLFSNIKDPEDICFRKTIKKDNIDYYIELDSDEEFDMVANHFSKVIGEEIKNS